MTDKPPTDTAVAVAPNPVDVGIIVIDPATVTQVDPEELYKTEFKAIVWSVLRNAGSNDIQQAHDAVQDAFTIALPRWDSIEKPGAWLRKVAMREFLRSDASEPTETVPEGAGTDTTTDATEQRRQEALVRATLQHLPFKQRQALAWAYDGFTPAEIAAELGQDPAAVRQNLSKARRNLRRHLTAQSSAPRPDVQTKDAP